MKWLLGNHVKKTLGSYVSVISLVSGIILMGVAVLSPINLSLYVNTVNNS